MKRKPQARAAKSSDSRSGFPENAATSVVTRENPKPFNLHLFTTACMLSAAALPIAADPSRREGVVRLVADMTAQMMRGLEAYKASAVRAPRKAYPVMWQDGSSRLLQLSVGKTPVLLVPSLVNRWHIMDLDQDHSFASFLAGQGHAVYVLDWGQPGDTEIAFRVDDYITERLYPAMAQLDRPHMIGYCMGGTMAAGALAAMGAKSDVRSLTLLAAPWDFHAGDKTIPLRMNAFYTSAIPVMDYAKVLPVDWIQALFASIDPLFAFNKFRNFAGMDQDGAAARRFVVTEDWLNDGVNLAAPAARQALDEWYVQNQPHNGVWTIKSGLADPGQIAAPTLVVAASGDRLVPAPSAIALHQQIPGSTLLEPAIGHIGMMASNRATLSVWQPVADFLACCAAS